MTIALLIIDVQHALCSGEYEAFEAKRVIERINLVSRKMREAGAPVVVIQHEALGARRQRTRFTTQTYKPSCKRAELRK
jgi:nicotinamidase-related amidase